MVSQQAVVDAGWLEGLDPGVPTELYLIPDGEDAKTLATVEELAAAARAPRGCRGPMW